MMTVERCTICRNVLIKEEIEAGNVCVNCLIKHPQLQTLHVHLASRRMSLVLRRTKDSNSIKDNNQ